MTFRHPSPLIVCGFVRSGTTMCLNMFNNSMNVELQGEMPVSLVKPTLSWLKSVKREYEPGNEARFYRLCRSVFRDTARSKPLIRQGARWFGHKMPRQERWFEAYEELFDHPEGRPHYVYCLRNPFDVWRSYRVMPWRSARGVRDFLNGWIQSVAAYEKMRTAAEERVILFNLDQMLAAPDQLAWFRAVALDALGLDPQSLRRPVEALKNVNSAEAKFGSAPPRLPEKDFARVARDPRVQRIIADYFPGVDHEAMQH